MQTPLKFCPNCGQPIKPNDDFCPNCGFDLRSARLQAQQTSENEASTPQPPTTPASTTAAAPAPTRHTPHSHRRWPWIVGIVVILIAGCA
ncbi:membrane protein, partial [Lacticaseibacillus rhamnosus]